MITYALGAEDLSLQVMVLCELSVSLKVTDIVSLVSYQERHAPDNCEDS